MQRWMIQSNIETHGLQWTIEYLQSKGYCFTLAYFMIFGRAPRV
jgi:hypothetical protein